MTASEPAQIYGTVLDERAATLRELGFSRSGSLFRKTNSDNVHLVDFQKSTTNSPDRVRFAVNLGIVCLPLLDEEHEGSAAVHMTDAHLRRRLSGTLEPPNNNWWEIDEGTDAGALGSQLSALLLSEAMPFFEQFASSAALLQLWESGQSPGLTEVQRARYLAELKRQPK